MRCASEAPWDAFPPAKLCRFMTPAKPFPRVMARTSTSCPGTKCAADSCVPIGSIASGVTRNSLITRFGPSPARERCPRTGADTALSRASDAATCKAMYGASSCDGASRCTCMETWFESTYSTVAGTRVPSGMNMVVIPFFRVINPTRKDIGVHPDMLGASLVAAAAGCASVSRL